MPRKKRVSKRVELDWSIKTIIAIVAVSIVMFLDSLK